MRYTFIQNHAFAQAARKTRLTPEDMRCIENEIIRNPTGWPVMASTGGLRKMRFAPESRHGGKSGGVRVCYFILDEYARVYLITVFAKNEAANLSKSECHAIKAMLAELKTDVKRKNAHD